MNLTCLTAKEFAMRSLKDVQQLSLHLIVATMHDVEEIQCLDLSNSISWLQEQKFPEIIVELCKLGKRVETSLIRGTFLDEGSGSKNRIPDVFPRQDGSLLPQFCYELFSQIFTESGRPRYILDVAKHPYHVSLRVLDSDRKDSSGCVAEKSASAVLLLRQILLLFAKATDLPVIADEGEEIRDFISRVSSSGLDGLSDDVKNRPGLSAVFSYARILLRELLCPGGVIHPSLAQWMDNPFGRHGPGAVANRERGDEKWSFMYDCLRLQPELYCDPYGDSIGTRVDKVNLYSRLCVVPKDFRGHRLICAEPKELQFAQQGLLKILEGILANSRLTNRHIALDDQMPSFNMSRHLKFGTIDLKDASDRITIRLLRFLLPREIFKLVTRFRSDGIILPDGTILKQYKTAFTMGNALCFPMETLVFWALSLATIATNSGSSITPNLSPFKSRLKTVMPIQHWEFTDDTCRWIREIRKIPLRVFGDDIIVPIEWVTPVSEILVAAGLVVNTDKTCELSLVRESCGSWWYSGFDCRITKLKYAATLDLQSWTSFQDVIPQLRENGLTTLASALEEFCRSVYPTPEQCRLFLGLLVPLGKKFEYSTRRGRKISSGHFISEYVRYNSALQKMEFRSPVRTADDTRALPGRLGYTSWFTQAATRFLNTHAQRIKFRWVELI